MPTKKYADSDIVKGSKNKTYGEVRAKAKQYRAELKSELQSAGLISNKSRKRLKYVPKSKVPMSKAEKNKKASERHKILMERLYKIRDAAAGAMP